MLKRMLTLVVCLLALSCTVVSAQETTGSLLGTVTDPAGAIVPNADVTLTNTQTGEERKAQTNENGAYVLTQIQPGTYDLSVRLQGFKEYVNKGFQLNVNDRKTLNITLETGAVSETVTVTGETPLIQTTPTVGDVVENRRVVELPLN
ncbi:MAG TPA: carboxypeptidase-like regulatory domain-containing protein, partial [Pyrinomonadaceae bacterium]|nr:carboxypeptidase-like regulatory domain-containing protein [Pyrinomonadaceae bacterium]